MPKVGYIAIIGRPNAGKSTFLNALIGEKVSAVSSRPQTTQRSIPGIYTDEEKGIQMIFLDTPGIHYKSRKLHRFERARDIHDRMHAEALASLYEADVVMRLIDPTRRYGKEDEEIDRLLANVSIPVIRVETKQDILNRNACIETRMHHIEQGRGEIQNGELIMEENGDDREYFPHKCVDIRIDSMTKEGFDRLIAKISEYLPEGPYLYSSDYYTDQPMDLRITEIIREILFSELKEEIPYATYVEIGSIEEKNTCCCIKRAKNDTLCYPSCEEDHISLPMLSIQAYINVETESQKVIVIGKGGKKIQEIGTRARLELEKIFGKKVFLALRVKVHKNWRKNEQILDKIFPRK